MALHISDNTIKPILTYGSEIWGSCKRQSRNSTRSIDTIYKDLHAEKLHLKFCQHILGVHSKASNMAILGELYRFPMYNDICENIIKFYLHVKQNRSDSLLRQTLEFSKQLNNGGYKSWFTGVTTILNETELDEENKTLIKYDLRSLYKNIWSTKLNEETIQKQGKLRTFALFKSNFEEESYLETVNDIYKRKRLTRVRLSAHRLEVESGRNKKQPVSERICKLCKLDQVEDEIHFLCNCSAYNTERQTFFASVIANIPNFRLLNKQEAHGPQRSHELTAVS